MRHTNPKEKFKPNPVNSATIFLAKSKGLSIFSVGELGLCCRDRDADCTVRQSAGGKCFLSGDADLDMPPPAWLGQGRKSFQLKDKTLFSWAMQDPK